MSLEVRLADERSAAGVAQDNPTKCEDMTASLDTVAKLVAAGWFSLRGEAVWQFEIQFRSQLDWAEFLARPSFGSAEADQNLLDAALSRPDGCI